MAEIKSTLELVMERTRHLKQSEEEKREQAVSEFKKSLNGLIQRFLDGELTPERFRQDLQLAQETCHVTDSATILDEFFKRLDLDGDHTSTLILLKEGFGIDPTGITGVFDEYRQAVNRVALDRTDEIRKELAEKQGVSGTAVVPNLAADLEWESAQQRLKGRFEPILGREFDNLKQPLHS
jgi:hypothetical protein